MIPKLLDILKEAKQVGILYHFTHYSDGNTLLRILQSGELKPSGARLEKNGYVSFTRDKTLGNIQLYRGARISIDGNKLSNKYKISPYNQLEPETEYDKEYGADLGSYTKANNNSEFEEIIDTKKYGGSINILPYIKQIDVITKRAKDINYKNKIIKLCRQNNIPINFINKF